jgi:hypothetical protein
MTNVRRIDELVLERKDQENETPVFGGGLAMMTPKLGGDYWQYRVVVSDEQAVVGFPKFTTIGVGFAVEDDWNTNYPYTIPAAETYDHIAHNAGDEAITREVVIRAIELIQDAVKADRAVQS